MGLYKTVLMGLMATLGIEKVAMTIKGVKYEVVLVKEHERIYIPPTDEVIALLEENGILYHVTKVKAHIRINCATN